MHVCVLSATRRAHFLPETCIRGTLLGALVTVQTLNHMVITCDRSVQITAVNAKSSFFFLREAGKTLSDGGKIIT